MVDTFRSFIDDLTQRHHLTKGAVAKAIGLSLSAYSRGVRIEGTLGIDTCLRLAEWSGESPSRVLRLAQKAETAELIERLYGPAAARSPLSGPDRELVGLWHELEPDAQKAISTLLHALAAAARLGKEIQPTKDRKRA